MNVMIRTADAQFATRHGIDTRDEAVVITVPADATESVTFAGREFIRFNIKSVTGTIPADWPNAWAMIPAMHII